MLERITSRTNPLIARARKLNAQRSARREEGLFLCDGVKMLEEALKWGAEVRFALAAEGQEGLLAGLTEGARLAVVPTDVMKSVSAMESPQGVLFACAMPALALPERLAGDRWLVLDGLQDPGNVGTIWRTADAFGCSGLVLVNHCADPFNPKTVRATMGAVFRTPVYEAGPEETAAAMKKAGLPLYATALRQDTATLGHIDLDKCAVVIGSEGRGVSQEMLEKCGGTVKIPMESRCESLNAAAAAAVVLWEMYRKG